MGEMTTDALLGNLTDPSREVDSEPIAGHGDVAPPYRRAPARPVENLPPPTEGPARHGDREAPNRA